MSTNKQASSDATTDIDGVDASKKEARFSDFHLREKVMRGIKRAGFVTPSPIQQESIPYVLEGRDLIAQAQTGTGKTAAFAIPILNGLELSGEVEALIITPTRELAMQISDEVYNLGKYLNVKTVCIYGGQPARRQLELLKKRPSVLVATPGRLLDFLINKKLKDFYPTTIVLDESDEMLDMGFLEDVEKILSFLPVNRQTLLFSATMPAPIRALASKILIDPVYVKITPKTMTNDDISQQYFIIDDRFRDEAIKRLLEEQEPTKCLIFTRTKKEADILGGQLQKENNKTIILHGDIDQYKRRETIKAFKQGVKNILVATDVAARGLDISDISHVFNYHIPLSSESYVHRIGRTGRAGKKGVAITLVSPLEFKDLKKIQHDTNAKLTLYKIDDSNMNKKIQKDIASAEINDKAISLYEEIKHDIDPTQLTLKLLSAYIDKCEDTNMGIDLGALEDYEEPKSHHGRGSGGYHARSSHYDGHPGSGSSSRATYGYKKPAKDYGSFKRDGRKKRQGNTSKSAKGR